MKATAWNSGNQFGVRVGPANRDRFFDREWTSVELEIDEELFSVEVTAGFWARCPELRERGHRRYLRDWLEHHFGIPWPRDKPPAFELDHLRGRRFRLRA